MLQLAPCISGITPNVVQQCLEMLAAISGRNDDYHELYAQFGQCIKLGLQDDSACRSKEFPSGLRLQSFQLRRRADQYEGLR